MASLPQINFANRKTVVPDDVRRLANWMKAELDKIEKRLPRIPNTRASFPFMGRLQGETVAVAAGSNSIVFPSPMGTALYALSLRVKYTDGSDVQINETSKSQSGFVVNCSDAGTLNYIAVENA